MPNYKRKRVKKSLFSSKKRINNDENNIIKPKSKKEKKTENMDNTKGIVPENEIKVVHGKKFSRSIRNKVILLVISIIILVYFILQLILPVSVYENAVNFTALIGSGKYPISISGMSIENCISNGNYYYVLTDTSFCVYDNDGQIIIDELHGFAHPQISTSETRAIVYDQDGKTLYVYNLGGQIHKLETENNIITANISRNGDVAISTHSEKYTSVVYVYDKDMQLIYTWNSAKDIVNNVIVNPDGDRLAVTTFNALPGQFESKMYILAFDSADPLHTTELNGSIALDLINTGDGVSILTENQYKYVDWTEYNSNIVTSSGRLNMIRKYDDELLLVFNRMNDQSDNMIVLISDEGTKTNEFKINNFITDIQYADDRIYCVTDTTIKIYDKKGNVLRYDNCGFGVKKIAVISSDSVAVITDSEIIETEIQKGAE